MVRTGNPAVRHGLHTHAWRRLRAAVLAESDLCHVCGHPGSQSVDHLIELARGGPLLDRRNVAPAHGVQGCPTCGRKCNQSRSGGLSRGGRGRPGQLALPFPTSRRWR